MRTTFSVLHLFLSSYPLMIRPLLPLFIFLTTVNTHASTKFLIYVFSPKNQTIIKKKKTNPLSGLAYFCKARYKNTENCERFVDSDGMNCPLLPIAIPFCVTA
jgi:hypothetical protein